MKPACTTCDRIHDPSNVRAIGRFTPNGPIGYRAMTPDAPLRSTRAEAMRDVCAGWVDEAAQTTQSSTPAQTVSHARVREIFERAGIQR